MNDRKIIYADDAIEAITNYGKFLWDNFHETCNLAGMIDAIEGLPSAQPEWNQGRWIRMYYNRPRQYTRICSECGEICWFCGIGDYNYCPWCGARMQEGEEDE